MCITTTPKNTPVWLSALSTNGRVGVCLGKRSTALRCGGMAMEGRRHGAAWADVQGRERTCLLDGAASLPRITLLFFLLYLRTGAQHQPHSAASRSCTCERKRERDQEIKRRQSRYAQHRIRERRSRRQAM